MTLRMAIDVDQLLWLHHEALRRRDRAAGRPPQAILRRTVSNAYYALFHELCAQIADLHVGRAHRGTFRYNAIYRAMDHGRARTQFRRLATDPDQGPRATEVAEAFLHLQSARHDADYNPSPIFGLAPTLWLVEAAEAAIACLRAGFPERDDVLTALLVAARS
ncbi:MAG: hypothetical protein KJS97_13490 [Alphaproteobacteria bacterium]|nr:hypothetical protein [Alphaproteobacteria bacterium]